jgi:Ca2+-binding RTX toxin-like protein
MVLGLSLQVGEHLVFDGSAETDGSFNIRGGRDSDTLTGGAGHDQLHGGLGADVLKGGSGNDAFEYSSVADSTASSRDTILDFAAGDKINLVAIDADSNASNGDSRFSFIGDKAFSRTAGELRAEWKGGSNWIVEADVDGDGTADLVIALTTADADPITVGDFWL